MRKSESEGESAKIPPSITTSASVRPRFYLSAADVGGWQTSDVSISHREEIGKSLFERLGPSAGGGLDVREKGDSGRVLKKRPGPPNVRVPLML